MSVNNSAEAICRRIDTAFADIAWPAAHNLMPTHTETQATFEEMQTPVVIRKFGGKRREQYEKEIQAALG